MSYSKKYRLFALLALTPVASFALVTAPVSGFARSFLLNRPIENATITVLETGQQMKTDAKGEFGPIQYPVSRPITLLFEKRGYQSTQTGTVVVPKEGLNDAYHALTFQVPSSPTFYLLSAIVGAKLNKNDCHVTSTITGYHKTLDDLPQGAPLATVSVSPSVNEKPFYFDIFKSGPWKDKTNPFNRSLQMTSSDGGVAFFNLPARSEPYQLTATRSGDRFTIAKFTCRSGVFINVSPPQGPHVILSNLIIRDTKTRERVVR